MFQRAFLMLVGLALPISLSTRQAARREAVPDRATRGAADTGYTPDSSPPRRIVMRHPVEVPLLRANARDSRAQVEVMVNGRGPYRFDIETGAREIGISRTVAESLGLRRIGGPDDYREYHLDSIGVGSATFHDMPVAQLPQGVNGVDGVLGLPFYQNVLLTIDYTDRLVRFSRNALPAPNGTDILPLVRIDAFWGVTVRLANKTFDAVLDTQNSGSISIPPSIADMLPFTGGLQTIGRARGTFGLIDIRGGKLAGDLVIGRYTFPTPFMDVMQLPPEFPRRPNIGTRLLDNFVVSIDQRHARLRLARAGDPVVHLPEPGRGRGRPRSGGPPG